MAETWKKIYMEGGTDVAIADGGTGASTAQAAIDALTAVSGAAAEHVLTKDFVSGNAIFKDSLKHTQGTDRTLGDMVANVNMNTYKLTSLSAPSTAGDSIRATAKITEVALESAIDLTVATDAIWDAAGDLVQGTGANTAAKLAKGGALALPRMNAGATAIEWGTGGQIVFPATAVPSADPNTIDDYEEGTWTPSLGGNTTYTVQSGSYTKIGNTVNLISNLTVNVIGTGSTTQASGLPFTASAGGVQAVPVAYFDLSATSIVFIIGSLNADTLVTLRSLTAAATSMGINAIFKNGTRVDVSGSYIA